MKKPRGFKGGFLMVLDAAVEQAFDDLTRLAAQICQTPLASICLTDTRGCSVRSKVGWTAPDTSCDIALCTQTRLESGLFIVRDALKDERFATNPLVIGYPYFRFYAGVPLRSPDAFAFGTLCVMDYVPRDLSPQQLEALQSLARQVLCVLELHRQFSELSQPSQEQDFLDNTYDLIQTVRLKDQGFVYVNRSWRQTLGYTDAEVHRLRWWDILHPDCRDRAASILEKASLGETIENVALIFLTKTGEMVHVEGNFSGRWENGQREGDKPPIACGIFRNVTGEKQAEAKYLQIFDNAAFGLFQVTIEGRYCTANPALANIYGYDSPTDFLAAVENIAHLYVEPTHWAECVLLLEAQGLIFQEAEVKQRDGSLIWISETIRLLRDGSDRPLGYAGSVQNITMHKQAEATVQMAKNQLQAVLDAVPGTVSLISSNFHYLGVNRHLAATYNLHPDNFVGKKVGFRESAFGKFVQEFFANSAEEAAVEIDTELNGAFRSDLVIAKKWLDDEAAVFVGIDITTRKQAEAALQDELAEAAEYVRSLLPRPLSEPLKIDWRFFPSQQLGGDSFDYYWLDDDHLAIYLLDVSGHGSRAALLSVSVLNVLRSRFLPHTNFYQPSEVLAALNQAFQMENQRNMYFTIWYGVYNRLQRQLVYASAGHPPAVLLSGTSGAIAQVRKLRTSGGLPIGMFPNVNYTNAWCDVEEFSTLHIFSDGIYEILQPDGSLWDLDSFIHLLAESKRKNPLSLDLVLDAVRTLSAKEAFDDDVSLLLVNFS